jgi:hypothetical protein
VSGRLTMPHVGKLVCVRHGGKHQLFQRLVKRDRSQCLAGVQSGLGLPVDSIVSTCTISAMADDEHEPDSPILHYLRSIDAKLDHINERLHKLLSAPKRKRAERTDEVIDPPNVLLAGTPAHAKKLRKKNPDAFIIVTGVSRANDD